MPPYTDDLRIRSFTDLSTPADLLREPDATIGSVARKVGYGSPFALSAAFKRVRGMSPQEYRAGAVAAR